MNNWRFYVWNTFLLRLILFSLFVFLTFFLLLNLHNARTFHILRINCNIIVVFLNTYQDLFVLDIYQISTQKSIIL